jgi:DNA-binding MarR family transcriptional regulator
MSCGTTTGNGEEAHYDTVGVEPNSMAPQTTTKGVATFLVPATRLGKVLSRLRQLHNDMTILQAMFFIRIAAEPGVTQSKLWDEFDTFDSVASRAVSVLGSAGVRGGLKANGERRETKGLELIELVEDPEDRRFKRLYLSARGHTLMADIANDLRA